MTLLYADTSALVKLLVREPESDVVLATVAGARVVSSVLAAVELTAVARRQRLRDGDELAAAIVGRLTLIPLSGAIVDSARVDPATPPLRALDLLHLATARDLRRRAGRLTLLAYDRDLLAAAEADGFVTCTPV